MHILYRSTSVSLSRLIHPNAFNLDSDLEHLQQVKAMPAKGRFQEFVDHIDRDLLEETPSNIESVLAKMLREDPTPRSLSNALVDLAPYSLLLVVSKHEAECIAETAEALGTCLVRTSRINPKRCLLVFSERKPDYDKIGRVARVRVLPQFERRDSFVVQAFRRVSESSGVTRASIRPSGVLVLVLISAGAGTIGAMALWALLAFDIGALIAATANNCLSSSQSIGQFFLKAISSIVFCAVEVWTLSFTFFEYAKFLVQNPGFYLRRKLRQLFQFFLESLLIWLEGFREPVGIPRA